ncbi:MAG: hypothetical protein QGH83_15930 [Candidatus Pacebacteria bacterium]|nr:hypothetical protein [Candidatus Paceibacterota bacterium]
MSYTVATIRLVPNDDVNMRLNRPYIVVDPKGKKVSYHSSKKDAENKVNRLNGVVPKDDDETHSQSD